MDQFMQRAYELAVQSRDENGAPYGAVIVRGEAIIGEGRNITHQNNDPTSHAEIEAIRDAKVQDSYADTVMYATGLPCIMCAGAIVRMNIPKVIVGAVPPNNISLAFMREHGIEVIELDSEACKQLVGLA